MLPGPDIIRACPACQGQVIETTIMSGNNLGAAFWSDGRMVAPMLPDNPRLVKCPHCMAPFWLAEARELGERELYAVRDFRTARSEDEFRDAIGPLPMFENDYLEFLAANALDPDDERYVRMHAWWAHNDKIRPRHNPYEDYPPSKGRLNKVRERFSGSSDAKSKGRAEIPEAEFSEPMRANLAALSSLLDEAVTKERIMKAEIARQLGDFQECERLLEFEWQEGLESVRDIMHGKCQARSTALARLG